MKNSLPIPTLIAPFNPIFPALSIVIGKSEGVAKFWQLTKAALLIAMFSFNSANAYEWTSPNGKSIKGKGLHWQEGGVLVERADNKKLVALRYDQIVHKDHIHAINNLTYYVNDRLKLGAKTVSTSSVKREMETGSFHLHANLHSYDGYHFEGRGTLKPITKKVRLSGRLVEVTLSSFFGGNGVAGIEFYALKGGGSIKPHVYHSEIGIFSFLKMGSPRYFSAPSTKDFKGWVVLVRSPNTGKIIGIASSLRHLEKYVVEKVPKIAKFKVNTKAIKKAVLDQQKKIHQARQKEETHHKDSKEMVPRLKVVKAMFGGGRKFANVTERVRDLVEKQNTDFYVSSKFLKKDPTPGWKKELHLTIEIDGKITTKKFREESRVQLDKLNP